MRRVPTQWRRLFPTDQYRSIFLVTLRLLLTALLAAGIGVAVAFTTGSPTLSYGGIVVVTTLVTSGLYMDDRLFPRRPSRSTRDHSIKKLLTDGGRTEDDPDAIEILLEAGVGVRQSDNEISLDNDFKVTWKKAVSAIRGTDKPKTILLRFLDIEAERTTFVDHGSTYDVRIDGLYYGNWESEAAFYMDMAATYIFNEKYDRWDDLPLHIQGEVLEVLRRLIDDCPNCDEPVTVVRRKEGHDPYEVMEIACDCCEAQLYASPYSPGSISE